MSENIENKPVNWRQFVPQPAEDGHKYDRGFVAILAAPELTGATRLAAEACSRIGAGLVTVVAIEKDDVYRTALPPDIMVQSQIPQKATVMLAGPGGLTEQHVGYDGFENFSAVVLDSAALPKNGEFEGLGNKFILTPHAGEFKRTFSGLDPTVENAARKAAELSNSIIVLKGQATRIAHPDGRLTVNKHASPYLAKAGTGDVLAGMIAGLVAQGMPQFEACCAAVWIHGEAGFRLGAGLIASDIPHVLPEILSELLESV